MCMRQGMLFCRPGTIPSELHCPASEGDNAHVLHEQRIGLQADQQ